VQRAREGTVTVLMSDYEERSVTASGFFTRRMRVRIFNAKFSPNLGDGLLSECLEQALVDEGTAVGDTWSIDLAARTAYGDAMVGREVVMSVMHRLPNTARQQALAIPLRVAALSKWRPHYVAGLQDADCVVIGGGNLLADFDLNFPTKLSLALREANSRQLPVAVYAVGVGREWSARGLAMMREAFGGSRLRGVFVRDLDSKRTWDFLFADSAECEATVVRDPGLLAVERFPQPVRMLRDARPIAGLGVISPLAIRYHGEDRSPSDRYLREWYVSLARELISRGHDIEIFTNGSPEDRAFLETIRADLTRLGSRLSFLEQATPAELCAHIARFSAMVAYRMHAVVAAYSYGVPTVALAWDRKLKSFMSSVGRVHYLCGALQTPARVCAELVMRARREGTDETERRRVLNEARQGVAQLYNALSHGTAFAKVGRESSGS
jgi:polysaccharide pyruvyl transferase WcaK-like protein